MLRRESIGDSWAVTQLRYDGVAGILTLELRIGVLALIERFASIDYETPAQFDRDHLDFWREHARFLQEQRELFGPTDE